MTIILGSFTDQKNNLNKTIGSFIRTLVNLLIGFPLDYLSNSLQHPVL